MNNPSHVTHHASPHRQQVHPAGNLPHGVPQVEKPPHGPAEATYYLALPHCNPTGVFFPAGFTFPDKFDAILFFHGFKLGEFKTINQYWSGSIHHIRLREDINASGRHPVLIAPTLGEHPGSRHHPADMRDFAKPAGGDDFLLEVLERIKECVPQYASQQPSINKLVLAGHSGAGVILDIQARSMKHSICEVWGFDSMYSHSHKEHGREMNVTDDWLAAAKSRPNTRFFFYWGTDNPGENAKKLGQLAGHRHVANITITHTVHNHFGVLTHNFLPRVRGSACFT